MALLNTHSTVKKFVHFGLSEDQAEAITEAINEQNQELATKADIAILRSEMNGMKTELKSGIVLVESNLKSEIVLVESNLKSEITEVRSELKLVESRLETKINDVKKDVSWIKTVSMATFTVLLGCLAALLFNKGILS